MKKMITLSVLCTLFSAVTLLAQIPNPSPIPVEVRMESQDGLIRTFEYTSATDWCDTLTQTISADLAWAYSDTLDMQGDSLLCDSNMIFNDLTGKIALIRRGECNFTLKAWNAQQAGAVGVIIVNHTYDADGGGLVNMAPGINAELVTIPSIFITRDDGDIILNKLDNGIPVTMVFEVRAFGGPRTAYSYHTPLSAVKPMADIGVTFLNIDDVLTIPEVTITAEITDPSSNVTTLNKVVNDLPPLSVNAIKFDEAYTPTAVGTYTVRFTNSLSADEISQDFVITDYTFALDNNVIVPNTAGTIEPSDDNFVNLYNFNYNMGNLYRTGDNPAVVTHASFMISNPEELFTDDPDSDVFKIRLYNADPDGNGSVPYPTAFPTINGLNENGGPMIPAATVDYVLTADDQPFDLTTVEFNSPVTLQANKLYLLMVEYNGVSAGVGIPPKFAFGGNDRMAGEVGTMIFTDSFRTDGWGNNYNGVIRMHLDGFATGTEEALDNSKLSLSPNPASDFINLNLELDALAEEVIVRIMDINGRMVQTQQLENVQAGTFGFDLSGFANGTYFMGVYTPEGFRAKKFQVMR